MLGRVRFINENNTEVLSKLEVDDYRARVQRGFIIDIEAFDWNCPQHITPRFTEEQVEERMTLLIEENRQLKLTVNRLEEMSS